MPSMVPMLPSTPMTPMTPVASLQNGRSNANTPTLNPFITEFSEQETPRQSPISPNVQTPIVKPMVLTPKSVPHRPPLPPVPPRQRAASVDKIRIPIEIVRRPKETEKNHADQVVMHPGLSNIMTRSSPTKTIPDTNGMEPVPEINGTVQMAEINGTPQTNGNSCRTETDLATPNPPCPCKSGAHPKHPHKHQENGFHKVLTAPGKQ